MKRAEQVTFGGSGLNRAAEIRTNVEELEAERKDPMSRCLLLWRGKILVQSSGVGVRGGRFAVAHSSLALF